MPAVTNRRVYNAFITLGNTAAGGGLPSFAPRQAVISPGRDTSWDIVRMWAYSTGYENIAADGANGQNSSDPYNTTRGNYSGLTDFMPLNYTPVVMIYRNSIRLDNLLQPFYFVPRSFEPVAPSSPINIKENESVVFFAGESIVLAGDGSFRKGRGVTVGIEVLETENSGV